MGELVAGNVGNVGKYDLKFEQDMFVAELSAEKGKSSAGVFVKIHAKDVLDLLEEKYPGVIAHVAQFAEDALFPADEVKAPGV